MATVTVVRNIEVPPNVVFEVVAEARQFSQAITEVTNLEFLSDATSGIGTRYRQSRLMHGKEMTMDFEVTEYVENDRVRIVNETGGTVWDSLFTVEPQGGSTTLTMCMEARAGRFLQKLMMPLVCFVIRKAVAKDIDALKAFCEGSIEAIDA